MKAFVDIETFLGAGLEVRHPKRLRKLLALLPSDFALRNVALVANENDGNLKGKLDETHPTADVHSGDVTLEESLARKICSLNVVTCERSVGCQFGHGLTCFQHHHLIE